MTETTKLETPGEPAGQQVDARAMRVTVAGPDLDRLPPMVVEPAGDEGGPDPNPLVDGSPVAARLEWLGRDRAVLYEGAGRRRLLLLARDRGSVAGRPGVDRTEVVIDGWCVEVEVESATRAALRDRARRGREQAGRSGPTQVHAIIPGVVVSVAVAPGDAVTAGQELLVVEAMKMQNELRSPRDGTIDRVAVGAGRRIEVGDLLVVLA
jgi:biotin carboxyl carrier protein